MSISLDQIRKRAEAKHARVMQALAELQKYPGVLQAVDVVREYLGEESGLPELTGLNGNPTLATPPRTYKKDGGTFRERVLAVTNRGWTTAEKICEETGMEPLQVRGVLHAKGLKGILQKREVGGRKEYKTTAAG